MQFSEHEFIPYAAERSMASGSVLVLAPHPDDEVFGCGGAIMRHLEAGNPLQVIIVTDGAFGHDVDRADYARVRQQESTRAGATLGYGTPLFWELPDRGLEYGEELIQRILAVLESRQVSLVYAPSWWEVHPDHLVLSLATAEAVRRCPRAVGLVMYEVGVPLQPNQLLDITDLRERKQSAMACFASQMRHQSYDRHVAALNIFRTYTLPAQVEAAEAFRVLSGDDLRKDPLQSIRPGMYYSQNAAHRTTPRPLVSILLLGTSGSQIADSLDSIALQTYPNIEILLADGETPDQAEPIAWCGRFPLRAIPSPHPGEPAVTANLALEQARGSFIAVLEAGTVLLPDHVSVLVDTLSGQAAVRCAYAGARIEQGPSDDPDGHILSRPIDRLALWGGSGIPLPAVLFARSLVDAGCRFDAALDSLDTWDFLVQLSRRTDLAHVDRVTVVLPPASIAHGVKQVDDDRYGPRRCSWDKWVATWSSQDLRDVVIAAREANDTALQSLWSSRESERQQANAKLAHLTAMIEMQREQLESETARRQAEVEHLNRDIKVLQSSTSWRITAPLRLLMTWLRRRPSTAPAGDR
jgi:LmbE family N-acetylglucosaminyl deacetylase